MAEFFKVEEISEDDKQTNNFLYLLKRLCKYTENYLDQQKMLPEFKVNIEDERCYKYIIEIIKKFNNVIDIIEKIKKIPISVFSTIILVYIENRNYLAIINEICPVNNINDYVLISLRDNSIYDTIENIIKKIFNKAVIGPNSTKIIEIYEKYKIQYRSDTEMAENHAQEELRKNIYVKSPKEIKEIIEQVVNEVYNLTDPLDDERTYCQCSIL